MSTYISSKLRNSIRDRADYRCEYCQLPESAAFMAHHIDHIIAIKHGGVTEAGNLALSCAICNKHKGSDLTSIDPESGKIVPLYNPRTNLWHDHFKIHQGHILPLTSTGRVTTNLLQINSDNRITERLILIEAGQITVQQ